MFPKNEKYEAYYNHLMAEIKEGNRNKIINDYLNRLHLYLIDQNYLKDPIDGGFIDIEIDLEKNPLKQNPNYFSEERIAVYTSIYGAYDSIVEPVTVPDNCDFYIFTDQEVPENSVWEQIEVDFRAYDLEGAENTVKNRFTKMHPYLFFSDYKYSLYIDGNIKVMTDPTEFIESMNGYGMILHDHYRVDCVYVEIERSREQGLGSDGEYDQQIAYLEAEGFPKNYGVLECPIIFYEHNNEKTQALLKEWWKEFLANAKRDQFHLPLVLWRHGIRTAELAGLGNDLYSNYAFQKVNHTVSEEDKLKYYGDISS